jgi:alpha-galactosidase
VFSPFSLYTSSNIAFFLSFSVVFRIHSQFFFFFEQLYGMMRDALNATGRPMFFAACEWGLDEPWEWGMETANSWRVGPDHLPLWWTPATSQDPGQGQGTYNIIEHMAGLSSFAGPGGWNDPDFLMTGIVYDIEFWWEDRDSLTEFTFWAFFPAPLIVASDVRDLSDKQVLLNDEAIAINQDPLGSPGDRVANNSDGGQVWTRVLSPPSPNQLAWAAVLYCPNDVESADITLDFALHLRGWPQGLEEADIRDLWAHEDLGTFSNTFTKEVGAHSVLFLKIVATQNK